MVPDSVCPIEVEGSETGFLSMLAFWISLFITDLLGLTCLEHVPPTSLESGEERRGVMLFCDR